MEKRSVKLDSLRGIAILIVVLGHALQASLPAEATSIFHTQLIIPMQMPLLMLLSGYALGFSFPTKDVKRFIVKKAKRLLLPYVAWSLIYYFLVLIMRGKSISVSGLVHELLHSNFWFLRQLFVNFLFVWVVNIICNFLFEKFNRNYQTILLIGTLPIAFILSNMSVVSDSVNGWHYLWFLVGYACFCVLSCEERALKIKTIWNQFSKVAVILGVLITGLIYNGMQFHFRLLTVVYVLFVCAVNEILHKSGKAFRFLGMIGENTLPIYAIHWCLLYAPFYVTDAFRYLHGIPFVVLTMTLFALWTALSVIIGKIISKNSRLAMVLLGK